MSLLNFSFDDVENQLNKLCEDMQNLKDEIRNLRLERNVVANAPMAREDMESQFKNHIKSQAEHYLQVFEQSNISILNHSENFTLRICFPDNHIYGHSPQGLGRRYKALEAYECFIRPETVMDGVKKALDTWDWSRSGLPKVQREKELKRMDTDISKLEKNYNQYAEKLNKLKSRI